MKPKVSVVMPVKNPDPVWARQAISSVLSQSMEDLELIIVEDPSPHSVRDIVRDLSDRRVMYVENPEPTSHVRQINRAIEESRADWIAHVDADDVVEPFRLRLQMDAIASGADATVLGGGLWIIDAAGNVSGFRDYPLTHDEIVRSMRRFNPMAHSTVLYRRSAVLDVGGYEDIVYPAIDFSVWCRLARAGARFANLPERLVRYRVHPDELKTGRLKDTIRATQWIKRAYLKDQFNARDRLRLLGESALLTLPDRLVLRLFKATQYRRARPSDGSS